MNEVKQIIVGGLIGRKIGMMQWFDEFDEAIGVTLLKVGPCVVTQIRTPDRDGYRAVQLGLIEPVKEKKINKPMRGHLKKAGAPFVKKLAEFPLYGDIEPGQTVTIHHLFQDGELVDVVGWSKGKGFQGVVKRHGFSGGPASHGSKVHRTPGSIGNAAYPGRVIKGMRMAGRTGGNRVKIRNLRIVFMDPEEHILAVAGGVPGAPGSYVYVYKAKSTLQGLMEEYAALHGGQ